MEHSWSISERVSELLAERDAANALILPTFFVPRLEICGADLTKVTILEGVKQADGRRTFSLQQDLPLGQQRHRRRRPSRVSRPPQPARVSMPSVHADFRPAASHHGNRLTKCV